MTVTTTPTKSGIYRQFYAGQTPEVEVHVQWMSSWGPRDDPNNYHRTIYTACGPGRVGWGLNMFPGAKYEFLRDLPKSDEGAA
jgi:hypothetical protein